MKKKEEILRKHEQKEMIMMIKIEYIRQQGPDCVVSRDGTRHVIKDCNAAKLENTLFDKLGPKYTNREMYKFDFIPDS